MVKKLVVAFSAIALIMTSVGIASAFMPTALTYGDMIMIPMKVKTTYKRTTGNGGYSAFFMDGCEQYTGGAFPWGTWKATTCSMKVQVIPPKCVAPAYLGPVGWGAPPSIGCPGGKILSNKEVYTINSPGCNPCVEPGLTYQVVRDQKLK